MFLRTKYGFINSDHVVRVGGTQKEPLAYLSDGSEVFLETSSLTNLEASLNRVIPNCTEIEAVTLDVLDDGTVCESKNAVVGWRIDPYQNAVPVLLDRDWGTLTVTRVPGSDRWIVPENDHITMSFGTLEEIKEEFLRCVKDA